MDTKKLKSIIIAFAIFDTCLGGVDDKYSRTFRHKRFTLYTYMKMQGLSELHCVMECSNDHQCGSINHKGDQQLCELNQHREEDHQHTTQLQDEQGWNHFIKDKQDSSQNDAEIFIRQAIRPIRGRFIKFIQQMERIWEVSFDFTLLEQTDRWKNAIVFTTDENGLDDDWKTYGNRIIAVYNLSGKMYFYYNTDVKADHHFTSPSITVNQKYSFKMRQTTGFVNKNQKYISIFMNGNLVHTRNFILDMDFPDVRCYITGARHNVPPTNAIISNFKYTHDLLYSG
uniref:Cnidarian restricted protein n=2 Tax=Clytia hemisphaerica TaxID=252671 RepID=A0A7M5XFG3_9CNID